MAAALDGGNEESLQGRAAATTTNNNGRNTNNNNNQTRKELSNPITVNAMREGVVAEDVYGRYVNEIIHFMDSWLYKNKLDWITDHGQNIYHGTNVVLREDERSRAKQKHIKAVWLQAV